MRTRDSWQKRSFPEAGIRLGLVREYPEPQLAVALIVHHAAVGLDHLAGRQIACITGDQDRIEAYAMGPGHCGGRVAIGYAMTSSIVSAGGPSVICPLS